ncbi:MAG: amidase [Gammaproteobacteria bacterium]|nr:amidase [Gammaproteobacteria bacterium]
MQDAMNVTLHQPATELLIQLTEGRLTSLALVEASLSRIAALNGSLQAFISVDADGARAAAEDCDRKRRSGQPLGALHGLPVAVKDVTDTVGLPTTKGSRLFAHNRPERDELSVVRLKAAGAIVLGKTNTPEFAFGAVCTNSLCGPTANPWDLKLSSGGSSGGSAVAVATGMVPLAQGTDFGGSVRTPAAFCGCVGLRPTPGTIAEPYRPRGWSMLSTQGALARNVRDTALMMSVMQGAHTDDPSSFRPSTTAYTQAVANNGDFSTSGAVRVAASVTFGGAYHVSHQIRRVFEQAVAHIEALLGRVEWRHPNVDGGVAAFKTLRAAESWATFGELVNAQEQHLSASFAWNVRQGEGVSASEYLHAENTRTTLYRRFQAFFAQFDVLVLPATSVMPFDNAQDDVWEIDGHACESIIDYLACTFLVSLVGFPTLCLPVPRQPGQLPVGIQLVAKPGNEHLLLQVAMQLEAAGFRQQWPDCVHTTN